MDGVALNLALVLLFVLIGGFFSASELALVSLRDAQVDRMVANHRRGTRVAALRADSNRFLAAVQIGVTLAGFFSAAYGGTTLAEPLGAVLAGSPGSGSRRYRPDDPRRCPGTPPPPVPHSAP